MPLPPDFLEELRARTTISAVVGKRVQLVKRGREHKGLCPFHNERTPSFTVNDDKAFYHCFGCGAHGDAVSFVMNTEGLEFLEAVARLAGDAGLEVPRMAPADPAARARRESIGAAREAACVFFEQQLRGPPGRPARDYLAGRGVTDEDVARFRIGYALRDRAALKGALIKQGFAEDLLLEAGVVVKPEGTTGTYDRFRGRVMFPIGDRQGRVVAFGGRILDNAAEGTPKYLNSAEGVDFQKGRLLYGLHLAREARAKVPELPVLAVEGYLDVVALHRIGVQGAVAPLGTALTEDQLLELWRLAPEPVLCFDGDAAGARAAERAAIRALPLLAPGRSLRFVTLPAGRDPDDLARDGGGADVFGAMVAAAIPLVDQLWSIELARAPADTPERRAALRQRLREHADHIGDRDIRRLYGEAFAARERAQFETPFATPGPRRTARGRDAQEPAERHRKDRPATLAGAQRLIDRIEGRLMLRTLLDHPWLAETFGEDLAAIHLADPELDRLLVALVEEVGTGVGGRPVGENDPAPASLRARLAERGLGDVVDAVLHPGDHDIGRQRPIDDTQAEAWLAGVLAQRNRVPAEDLQAAERHAVEAGSPEAWAQFRDLVAQDRATADDEA